MDALPSKANTTVTISGKPTNNNAHSNTILYGQAFGIVLGHFSVFVRLHRMETEMCPNECHQHQYQIEAIQGYFLS